MHRSIVLLALVGCEPPPTIAADPVPRALYPATPPAWPLGVVSGRIGRSQAPQIASSEVITGEPRVPLRLPTPWAVPGDGIARAIVFGLDRDQPAIELVEIDRARVVWRDTTACAAPVVGVTREVVVCADAHGTRAVALDGKPRWHNGSTFIAITDDRVVTAGPGESVILDANTGDELARVKLPAGVTSDSIIASCGDTGRELFATAQDGKLSRIAEGKGGPKIAWSIAVGSVAGIEACIGTSVLVTSATDAGTALVAIARESGKITGRVDGVRGYWPARNGTDHLEVSTAAEVTRYPRELSSGTPIALPLLGELLGKRGDRRLLRATPLSAALLDRDGVRAYVPLAEMGAVLGDDSILAASWRGSLGETVHRVAIPEPWQRGLRVRPRKPPVAVAAELRDLPVIVPLDVSTAIARSSTAMQTAVALALDSTDAHALYVVTLEAQSDDRAHAGIAKLDLAARAWGWVRVDGCGPGAPIAIAAAREIIVCAAHGSKPGTASVVATGRDGAARWSYVGDNVDGMSAAGDVVLVHDADRLFVLDADNGNVLGFSGSNDGAAVRAAAIDVAGMTVVVTYEQGRVVARLPRANMVPAWSIATDGIVRALSPSGDGVLVELDDGDAFRIDVRTAIATSIPGLDLVWRAPGDVITGQADGGPIPPDKMPSLPPLPPRRGPVAPRDPDAAPISRPWPAPSPMAASWQLTLYEQAGGLRARNDYALATPISPTAARGPGDSPFVIEYGPGLREVLVIEPRRGDPVRRIRLPDDAPSGVAFATIVDGRPVAGTILATPLRAVLF